MANLKNLACPCGTIVRVDAKTEAVRCGRCVQAVCAGAARVHLSELAQFTPEVVKAFRAERGWTQEILAIKAQCSVEDVRVVEQGRGLASDKLGAFLEKEA